MTAVSAAAGGCWLLCAGGWVATGVRVARLVWREGNGIDAVLSFASALAMGVTGIRFAMEAAQ